MQVEINGTIQCAANDVDILESVNQHHDSRNHMMPTCVASRVNSKAKRTATEVTNRRIKDSDKLEDTCAGRTICGSLQKSSPTKPQDGGPPTSCGPTQSKQMPDNSGTSERAERTTCNHSEFCAMWMCSFATVLQTCGPTCDDNGKSATLCCRGSTTNRKSRPRTHVRFEIAKVL